MAAGTLHHASDKPFNLLSGLVGVQIDLLEPDQFLDSWEQWKARSYGTLTEFLEEESLLTSAGRYEVERLVQRKLGKHGGDAWAAVAGLVGDTIHETFLAVKDPELLHALPKLAAPASNGRDGVTADSDWRIRMLQRSGTGRHRLVRLAATCVAIVILGLALGMFFFPPPPEKDAGLSQPNIAAANEVDPRAAKLVNELFTAFVRKADVLDHLQHDRFWSDGRRPATTKLAAEFKQNADSLNNAAWYLVALPGRDIARYRHALLLAEEACQLAPKSGYYVNTLGVAQYRVGLYAEALDTLGQSSDLNSKLVPSHQPHPADLAFRAMAHHELGHNAQARADLVSLKKSIDASGGGHNVNLIEMNSFLQEAKMRIEDGK